MEEFFGQLWQLLLTVADPRNLTNPDKIRDALSPPGVMWAAVAVVNLIVFAETGLLFGFLLPGDSLLVTTGIVAHGVGWPVGVLLASLCVSAVVGDSVGYWLGSRAGPAVFNRPSSRFFKRDHLLAAKAFYERHGGKTIVLARFVPIIRTFVPFVAGAARMDYRRFLAFNLCGGVGWILSMILLGYTMHLWLEPILESLFGRKIEVARNIDKVIVVVVGLSVLPILWKAYQGWRASKSPAAAVAAAVTAVEPPAAEVVQSKSIP